jgi:hypothetical protein
VREQDALTDCRAQRDGQVKASRESKRARDTHQLLTTEGGTSQGTNEKRDNEGRSLSVKHRGCTSQDTKIMRESEGAHSLSSVDGDTSQDTKKK